MVRVRAGRPQARDAAVGDVGGETRFEYHEEADATIWARYQGGTVRLGFLVGARRNDELAFRYSHVTTGGETASGHCRSQVEVLAHGRLLLREEWQWERQEGTGASVVEEVTNDAS